MKIELKIAAISHLSDSQELIAIGDKESANAHINFVKKMLMEYSDLNKEVEDKELNALWYDDLSTDRTF